MAFMMVACPPLALVVFYLYGLTTTSRKALLAGAYDWGALVSAMPALAPVTAFAGAVFVALAFGIPFLRRHVHNRLVCAAVAAAATASPLLIELVVRLLQGHRPAPQGNLFLLTGLLVGMLAGAIFPKRLLPPQRQG
ncbi:MAG: hypothetical protein K0R03_2583 [Moraxellaceae bacterium]|jgi:hypothetical protein|nr:hypothetical protein [Moraxellaceae bacterium]